MNRARHTRPVARSESARKLELDRALPPENLPSSAFLPLPGSLTLRCLRSCSALCARALAAQLSLNSWHLLTRSPPRRSLGAWSTRTALTSPSGELAWSSPPSNRTRPPARSYTLSLYDEPGLRNPSHFHLAPLVGARVGERPRPRRAARDPVGSHGRRTSERARDPLVLR